MHHMKIFLLNFNDFTITKCFKLRGTEYKENAGLNYLVWFSPRGDFKLKTILPGGLKVNG